MESDAAAQAVHEIMIPEHYQSTLLSLPAQRVQQKNKSNDEGSKRSSVKTAKTYNSGDSPVVTHLTTSPPVRCLNRAERTGSLVFNVLWSYVE
jgi:hypothetical protein